MKMRSRNLLVLLFTLILIRGYGQSTVTERSVKIRIKNSSKFLIMKLALLDKNFENIKPGSASEYVEVKPFYPSMKVNITIGRRRIFRRYLWYHIITYPIDHVGEKLITNDRNTLVITIVKAEERGEINVVTRIINDK